MSSYSLVPFAPLFPAPIFTTLPSITELGLDNQPPISEGEARDNPAGTSHPSPGTPESVQENAPPPHTPPPRSKLYKKNLVNDAVNVMSHLQWLCKNPICSNELRIAVYGEMARMLINLRQIAEQVVKDGDSEPRDVFVQDAAEALFSTCPQVCNLALGSIMFAPLPHISPIPVEIKRIPAMLMEYLDSVARASHTLNRQNQSRTAHLFSLVLEPRRSLVKANYNLEVQETDTQEMDRHIGLLKKLGPRTAKDLISSVEKRLIGAKMGGNPWPSSVVACFRSLLGILSVVPGSASAFLENDRSLEIVSAVLVNTFLPGTPEGSVICDESQENVSSYDGILRAVYFDGEPSLDAQLKERFVLHLSKLLKVRPCRFLEPYIRHALSRRPINNPSKKTPIKRPGSSEIAFISILDDYIATIETKISRPQAESSTNPTPISRLLSKMDVEILRNVTILRSNGTNLAIASLRFTLSDNLERLNAIIEVIQAMAQKSKSILSRLKPRARGTVP
ncbi:hypothetical protein CVT24_010675 [Panaeolus cyanescens]|uniref:Uncharacterized protein n=1 Tax=Panaeolus cyanescens TaxID=181874 RepID=A0A409YM49_9AGAR|nr:hypothetical protein CVT24_010675 [Panaeolus cyanescens]